MANLKANTKLNVGIYYNFYEHRFYGGDTYIHYKTNIATGTYIMGMVEAVGYAYGANAPIRAAWVFYAYSTYIANPGTQNFYGGLSANGVYLSSDNYVCLRALVSPYFSGWSFNSYCLNPAGLGTAISFQAVSQNTNSGNYY
jgi:hypothetical protein